MFRKKNVVMQVLRVKEPGKQFLRYEYTQKITWAIEIITFLKETLGLESVQVLNGPMVDLFDGYSLTEFNDYFYDNEVVDLLIPKNVPTHEWKLRSSNV